MSKEPLWTDAKIASLTFQNANNLDPDARWMHEQVAKDMRNDYERALAFRNEDIGRLQQALKGLRDQSMQIADNLERVMRERDLAQAQVAELKAERLVQVDKDEDLFDPINQAVIRTMYSGTALFLDYTEELVHLPAGYCIAKVQPAE